MPLSKGLRSVSGLLVLMALAALLPFQLAAAPGDERVDINKASAQQLTEIPGIGEVTAARIVEWREEHGPFRRVEDLLKVKGIGEKSLEKLRSYVKVGKSG